MREKRNSIANALELRLCCTDPSLYGQHSILLTLVVLIVSAKIKSIFVFSIIRRHWNAAFCYNPLLCLPIAMRPWHAKGFIVRGVVCLYINPANPISKHRACHQHKYRTLGTNKMSVRWNSGTLLVNVMMSTEICFAFNYSSLTKTIRCILV